MATLRQSPPEMIIDADEPGLEAAVQLMQASFPGRYGEGWPAADLRQALGWPRTRLRLLVRGVGNGSRQADRTMEYCGFALARAVADETELLMLAVDPAERNRGYGRKLLADMIALARAECTFMILEVRDSNAAALALYEKAGFQKIGRRPNYYRGSTGLISDAVTLSLDLKQLSD